MKTLRPFQFSAALAVGLVLLLFGMATGAPGSATRPAHIAEGDAQTNVYAAAPAPANRSPTDSLPIHRSSPESGGTSATKSPGMETPRVAGALAAVIALIFLLKWGGKKLLREPGAGKTTRAVQVLARSAVSHRQQILLVMVGKRLLVVGDSGAQMNALSEITDPDEVAALVGQVQGDKPELAARAFGAMFGRANAGMAGVEKPDEGETSEGGAISRESQATGAETTDAADASINHAENEEAVISDTREELNGLMERVRLMSRQLHKG